MRFTLDTIDGDVWVDVHLVPMPWWRRIWFAARYVLGIDVDLLYEETILRHEDYVLIRDILDRSERVRKLAQENLVHIEDGPTLPVELNSREARALSQIVVVAREKNVADMDRESHDGVHTVYPKIINTYERLLERERVLGSKKV